MKNINTLQAIEQHVKATTNWICGIQKGDGWVGLFLYNSGGVAAGLVFRPNKNIWDTSAYNNYCLKIVNDLASKFEIPLS